MNRKLPPSPGAGLPLPVGTSIVALRDFGAIRRGVFGIITGTAREPFLQGNRPVYVCTFANNMKTMVRTKEVESCDHGFTLDELEAESFVDVLARRKAAEAAKSAAAAAAAPE